MPKISVVPTLYFTPIIDLSDLSAEQADSFVNNCATYLDGLTTLFFDNLVLDEAGQLFTNTPLDPDQLEEFINAMEIE